MLSGFRAPAGVRKSPQKKRDAKGGKAAAAKTPAKRQKEKA